MKRLVAKADRCALRNRLLAALCAIGTIAVFAPAPSGAQPASPAAAASQSQPASSPAPPSAAPGSDIPVPAKPEKGPRTSQQRRAAKLYLESSKQFLNRQFEEAMQGFEKAAELDPSNQNYRLAADVARSHAVTAWIQTAAKDRLLNDSAGARAALSRALALDPQNFVANQHLDELGDEAARQMPKQLYYESAKRFGSAIELAPTQVVRSFHMRLDQRQLIAQVFKAYGIDAMLDDSVRGLPVRLDLDDVRFADAARIVSLVTHTFFVPLDTRHALVANDTREIRQRLEPEETETIYLSGMSADEMSQIDSLAKNVFEIRQAQLSQSPQTLTLRAPVSTLNAFNTTMQGILEGRGQVVLDVQIIQVAHTGERNTGMQLPQSFQAFNVLAEYTSLLNANASKVAEIISSGLASADDPLAILAILIADGDVSSSLLTNGFAVFGGGLTESAFAPGKVTLNLNLNTSDSRALDHIQLRLQDGDDGTIKEGERYPIQTSKYSSLSSSSSLLAGLTSAGTSSSLSSLLSSLTSSTSNVPMVQYEDLGLTLKVNPKVLRNGDVALNIDMKMSALSGSTLDGNPILDNRAYSGVVTLKEGEATVVSTNLNKSMSRAISGTPGVSEIPGLNDLTGKDNQQNYATLVIVMTPHVVRGARAAGHTPMIRIERETGTQ